SFGFGRHLHDMNPDTRMLVVKYFYLSEVFILVDLPICRISFGITLLKISVQAWQKAILWFCMLSLTSVCWLQAIFILTQCNPVKKNWDRMNVPGTCRQRTKPWETFGHLTGEWSAAMDFVMAALPVFILYKLQIRTLEKIGVILAMSCGAMAGIMAAIKTAHLQKLVYGRDDTTFHMILSIAEVCVTMVATSIPFLRPLV
ncbi:hypothetical protein CC80DRAFT_396473, partial [Byssothecium circinans]